MTDNERKLLLHVAELLDGWSSNLDSLVGAVNEETRLRPTPSFTAMSLEDIAYYAGVEERMKKYREERDAQMAKMNSPEGKKAARELGAKVSAEDEIARRVEAQRQAWVEHGATMARDAISAFMLAQLGEGLTEMQYLHKVCGLSLTELLKGGSK